MVRTTPNNQPTFINFFRFVIFINPEKGDHCLPNFDAATDTKQNNTVKTACFWREKVKLNHRERRTKRRRLVLDLSVVKNETGGGES